MTNNISQEEMRVLLRAQQGEVDAVKMYLALAKTVKNARDVRTFEQLAAEEGRHAAVFKARTNRVVEPKNTKAILLPLLYRVLGRKRVYPLIAKGEYDAVEKYRPIIGRYPEVESVMNDEQRHGDTVLALL